MIAAESPTSTKSCVVTGASGAIGHAIVTKLLANGWAVVGTAADRGVGAPLAHERYRFLLGDVADPAAHREAADVAEGLGTLQGWVNCAGYNIIGSVAEADLDAVKRGVEVNLLGYFYGAGEACRRFLRQPDAQRTGSIVHIGSIQASQGFPGFAAYAMCKGGIEALSRQIAAEYVGRGIRSNVVAPGLISSPINDLLREQAPDPDALQAAWTELTPMGRWGTGDDCAAAVAFFLSNSDSGYVTGEVLGVNGGASILARGQQP